MSIISQDYKSWEAIVVNDGSTDNTFNICEKVRDERILIINKPNSGVSDSRNVALAHAKGDYVIFLDSDDYWLSSNVLSTFKTYIERYNPDIIRGEYCSVFLDGSIKLNNISSKSPWAYKELSCYEFIEHIIKREFFSWLFVIKMPVLKNACFNPHRVFLEDVEFFLKLFTNQLNCFYIPFVFYGYRRHDLSISSQINIQKLKDAFDICRLFISMSLSGIDNNLSLSYKSRAWDYYWLTLRTIASENTFFHISDRLCEEFSLISLRQTLCKLQIPVRLSHKWLRFVSPKIAVLYFRLRHLLGKTYRKLKYSL